MKSPEIIGMVHLMACPGAPLFGGNPDAVIEKALADADALVSGGIDAMLVENAGDTPFLNHEIDYGTVAMVAVVARELRETFRIPVGIDIATNGATAALAAAKAAGAEFIRITGWCSTYIHSTGIVTPCAAEALRYRRLIGGAEIRILADIEVKHASHQITSDLSLEDRIRVAYTNGAEGIILTGRQTGEKANLSQVMAAKETAPLPVYIGSGADRENIGEYLPYIDGAVVGTSLKTGGMIDRKKTEAFMAAVRGRAGFSRKPAAGEISGGPSL